MYLHWIVTSFTDIIRIISLHYKHILHRLLVIVVCIGSIKSLYEISRKSLPTYFIKKNKCSTWATYDFLVRNLIAFSFFNQMICRLKKLLFANFLLIFIIKTHFSSNRILCSLNKYFNERGFLMKHIYSLRSDEGIVLT